MRWPTAAALALILAAASSRPTGACQCISWVPPLSLPERSHEAAAVFTGEVVATGVADAGTERVFFAVERSWKGSAPVVEVRTSRDTCGFPAVLGRSYLVLAFLEDGALSTGLCSSVPLPDGESQLAELGPPTSAHPIDAARRSEAAAWAARTLAETSGCRPEELRAAAVAVGEPDRGQGLVGTIQTARGEEAGSFDLIWREPDARAHLGSPALLVVRNQTVCSWRITVVAEDAAGRRVAESRPQSIAPFSASKVSLVSIRPFDGTGPLTVRVEPRELAP